MLAETTFAFALDARSRRTAKDDYGGSAWVGADSF